MNKFLIWCRHICFILVAICFILVAILILPNLAVAEEEFSQEQLDQIMAPIALYPDSLLSQVLMASTYPVDVAEAAKWSKENREKYMGDDAVKAVEGQDWDPSVKSLIAFPQALEMMGDKPDWVQQVGDAFLADSESVLDTVQGLRKRAKDEGNLESSEEQNVIVEETIIKVEPADPQVVYVPAYNPTVVYGTWWYPYYPPPFYWPPPPYYGFAAGFWSGIGFGIGIGITNSLWGGCNWSRGEVDIDVNRYNNIHVNNKIDGSRKNTKWNHNPENRKGAPYRDAKTRAKYDKQRIAGAEKRKNYRGKDASRLKAQQSLQKRGVDPAKSREKLRNDPQTMQRAQQATKKSNQQFTKGNRSHNQARANAQNRERSQSRSKYQNKSSKNAFSNAGNKSRSQQSYSRGSSSRSSMHRTRARAGHSMSRGGDRSHGRRW